jgi:hypothetical protein
MTDIKEQSELIPLVYCSMDDRCLMDDATLDATRDASLLLRGRRHAATNIGSKLDLRKANEALVEKED